MHPSRAAMRMAAFALGAMTLASGPDPILTPAKPDEPLPARPLPPRKTPASNADRVALARAEEKRARKLASRAKAPSDG